MNRNRLQSSGKQGCLNGIDFAKGEIRMTHDIGFIGGGNMAGAIIEGIVRNKVYAPDKVAVYDINPDKCARFEKLGVQIENSIKSLALCSDIIVMAVKPQNYDEVLAELNGNVNGKIVVTIAAGISTQYVGTKAGGGCQVVRAMPNTPLLLGEGATALCRGNDVTDTNFEKIKTIFEAGGIVCVLPEDKMNAVISVNSTSPAYVYLFAKAVIDGGKKQGIDEETSKELFAKTLIGSAKMIMESGRTPDELIKMVASPGGTTLKALEALYEHNVEDAIVDAMLRCTKRAEELGK